jgi:hypothetical protein
MVGKKEQGQVLFAGTGHRVASVGSDGTLSKTVKASKHMLRFPAGWAFDRQLVERAGALGATRVEVVDSESGKRYHSSLDNFLQHAEAIERGYGPQLVLPLFRWSVENDRKADTKQLGLAI